MRGVEMQHNIHYRTLKNKTQKDTMIKFYKTMTTLCLLYGSEIWTVTQDKERRIQSLEAKLDILKGM